MPSDKPVHVELTPEEVQALSKAVAMSDMLPGPDWQLVESALKKINRELNIRKELLAASEDDACENCDQEDCPAQCLESLGDRGNEPMEFTESEQGYRARERWAERYDDLNGAPESDDDR